MEKTVSIWLGLILFSSAGIIFSISQSPTERAKRVSVIGQVNLPRSIEIGEPRDLWELIGAAGGGGGSADLHSVRITFNNPYNPVKSVVVDAVQLREEGRSHLVASGSTVHVPEMLIGDAGHPRFARQVRRFEVTPEQALEKLAEIAGERGGYGESPAFILGEYYGFSDGPYNSHRTGWVVHGHTGAVKPLKDGGIEHFSN